MTPKSYLALIKFDKLLQNKLIKLDLKEKILNKQLKIKSISLIKNI